MIKGSKKLDAIELAYERYAAESAKGRLEIGFEPFALRIDGVDRLRFEAANRSCRDVQVTVLDESPHTYGPQNSSQFSGWTLWHPNIIRIKSSAQRAYFRRKVISFIRKYCKAHSRLLKSKDFSVVRFI